MKQKLLEMVPVTALFHTAFKTAPRVPKLGYINGRVQKLSSLVTLGVVVISTSLYVFYGIM